MDAPMGAAMEISMGMFMNPPTDASMDVSMYMGTSMEA